MSDEKKQEPLNPEILKKMMIHILREEKSSILLKRSDGDTIKLLQKLIYDRANSDIKQQKNN